MRSALLLTLGAFAAAALARALAYLPIPGALRILLEAALTALGFGGAGYLGLRVMDGDHTRIVARARLSAGQILWLALVGALAVAPASLIDGLALSLRGAQQTQAAAMRSDLFLLTLLKSALLAPLCEELFFRGYLLGALAPYGKKATVAATALLFAMMHGGGSPLVLTLMGVMLGIVYWRTNSLYASVLVHAAYNLTIVLLAYTGLDGLFGPLTLFSCALRLALCLALAYAFRRAWTARPARERSAALHTQRLRLTRRELALVCGAAAAALLAAIVTGVLA